MSDTEILRTLFKESLFVPVNDGRVILVETGQPDSQVTICNVPDDAVCIKADEGIDLRGFFGNTARGECKRADYLLFSERRRCVLIIEIKRNKDLWSQVCQQLHGASCLASYCRASGRPSGGIAASSMSTSIASPVFHTPSWEQDTRGNPSKPRSWIPRPR